MYSHSQQDCNKKVNAITDDGIAQVKCVETVDNIPKAFKVF